MRASKDLTPANLGEIAEEAIDRFGPTLSAQGFDVNVDVPSSLPFVLVNRPAIVHAVQNLIDNAIKYASADHSINVAIAVNGSYVKLTVADKGMGIPKDDVPHVFEQFYRGQNATTRGSGLGLAIVYRIIHYHGGRVQVHSEVGSGTEVDLFLPKMAEA